MGGNVSRLRKRAKESAIVTASTPPQDRSHSQYSVVNLVLCHWKSIYYFEILHYATAAWSLQREFGASFVKMDTADS